MAQHEPAIPVNTKGTDLRAFLKANYNDRIILFSKSNYHLIRRPLLVAFHYFKSKNSELKKWIDTLYKISLKFPKTIQFAIMEFEDAALFHSNWNDLNRFDFDSSKQPPKIYAIDASENLHEFDEEFTADGLISFCEYLEKNDLYYSEPMPIPSEQNPTQNVHIIVADNFRELVEHNDKDVFVTLHSKCSFRYEFDLWKVPQELQRDSDTLVFYGINAYTNYIPLEYRVSELPTSFLIPRNDRSKRLRYVHKYCDGEEIKRFIAKHASVELKTLDRNGLNRSYPNETKPKLDDILKTFDTIAHNMICRNIIDEDGFQKYLGSILRKLDEKERNQIEMELVTLALNRINKIEE